MINKSQITWRRYKDHCEYWAKEKVYKHRETRSLFVGNRLCVYQYAESTCRSCLHSSYWAKLCKTKFSFIEETRLFFFNDLHQDRSFKLFSCVKSLLLYKQQVRREEKKKVKGRKWVWSLYWPLERSQTEGKNSSNLHQLGCKSRSGTSSINVRFVLKEQARRNKSHSSFYHQPTSTPVL